MTERKLTKDEIGLLLYFETRAVDYRGAVDTKRMNKEDMEIAKRWNETGFVVSGRIAFADVGSASMWCALSNEAWARAHAERRDRAARGWAERQWQTTEEKRSRAEAEG